MRKNEGLDENLVLFSSKYIKQKEYWRNKLSGEIEETKLLSPVNSDSHQDAAVPARTVKTGINFPIELAGQLIKLSKQSHLSLYIILFAGVNALISRYAYEDNRDITVISPVFKHRQSDNPLTNRLFIRNRISWNETFKELILKTRDTILAAYENQDYPYDTLLRYIFNVPDERERETDDMLTDILCALDNIHDRRNIAEIKNKFTFWFSGNTGEISGDIIYNPEVYPGYYTRQIGAHLVLILTEVVKNINIPIGELPLLTPAEKQQLLKEWNSTYQEYPEDRLIQDLFQARAIEVPDRTVLVDEDRNLTYKEFNSRANSLARELRRRGARPDDIIGIMGLHSLELMTGLMGILKSGAAYLPLDPFYPDDRPGYMLEDSQAGLVLVQGMFAQKINKHSNCETLILDSSPGDKENKQAEEDINPKKVNQPNHLAYVIYTSGSTGRAKGVLVEHGNLVAYLHAFDRVAHFTGEAVMIQLTSYSFDIFVEEFYAVLVKGGRVVIFEKGGVPDMERLPGFIKKYAINIIDTSPLVLNQLNQPDLVDDIRLDIILSGGDALKGEYIHNLVKTTRILNGYGPTEITVCTSFYECTGNEPAAGNIFIGKPIANYNIYILDRECHLLPIGAAGELCVAGPGVSRGYLNRPELTARKFLVELKNRPGPGNSPVNAFSFIKSRLYKTGDFARWHPDGNIEFLGRLDNQVQIRGFRVEPEEIQARLMQHPDIKEALVITNEDCSGDKCLCAYYVTGFATHPDVKVPGGSNESHAVTGSQLREFLSDKLPYYMVPAYFVRLEKVPLTPTGKIDRKALPEPDFKGTTNEYTPPRDKIEEKLVEIWAGVLKLEKELIGIQANFFELGGHSLKATALTIKINKEMDTKISMVDIFSAPTIRELAGKIKGALKVTYSPIKPVEKRDYYPLSSAQQRMYLLQQMEVESIGYNISEIVVIEGALNRETLGNVFKKLIQRHESLRTCFEMPDREVVQRVRQTETVDFMVEYSDLETGNRDSIQDDARTRATIEKKVSHFVRPFEPARAPLMRCGIIKVKESGYVMMLDMHHLVSDGMSHMIFIDELIRLYMGEELSPLGIQYKDYSQWEAGKTHDEKTREVQNKQETYWLNEFSHEIPNLDIPFDYERPKVQGYEGDIVVFVIGEELIGGIQRILGETRATLFMVLFAIYTILLYLYTRQQDIIVGVPVTGRMHAEVQPIIGMFSNMLALRVRISKEKTFREFLEQVKEKSINAFDNQDYHFEQLLMKLGLTGTALFNTVFAVENMEVETAGDERQTTWPAPGLRLMPYEFENKKAKHDLIMEAFEGDNEIRMNLTYAAALFKRSTVEKIKKYYREILEQVLTNPDIRLSDIAISYEKAVARSHIHADDQGDFVF